MRTGLNFCNRSVSRIFLCLLISASLIKQPLKAQNIEAQTVIYNTLLGGLSGGIGSIINKKQEQKWYVAFAKGFLIGSGGGAIAYGGKKMNYLVGEKNELGYAWASRFVFSIGNSIVENASSNIDLWSRWHFDIGFIRLEFKTGPFNFQPRIMPSTLGGILFIANYGKFNLTETMCSGTPVFNTDVIKYAPQFFASTVTNGVIHTTNLAGHEFYSTFGHEMVHTFQFQEFSGTNYFLLPSANKLKAKSVPFAKWSKWIYLDINYELMGVNYFFIQGGYQQKYYKNYLENEAEFLSTGHALIRR